MEYRNRAVGERLADALHDGAGGSPADAVVASQRPADQRDTRKVRAAYVWDDAPARTLNTPASRPEARRRSALTGVLRSDGHALRRQPD